MTRRSPVPPSPAFEATARGAQFRDRIAVVVKAPPEAIFQALHEVTLRDMKLAWLLGELRYLPSRLAGHMPAADSRRPFMKTLIEGGTLDPARRCAARGDHRIGRTAAPRASGAAAIRQPRGVRGIRRSRPREAVHERARGADRPPG